MSTTIIEQKLIQGGVSRVIDSATGDIAITANGWIEDEKYGFRGAQTATAWSAEFDSAVTRTGRLTLKLSNTDVTGRSAVIMGYNGGTSATLLVPALSKYAIPLKGSTSYRISIYIKTNNFASQVPLALHQYAVDGTRVTNTNATVIAGTNDWTLRTITVTTGAATIWGVLSFNNSTAGNISDAWYDVNSMTLEEVSTITNSSSSPALLYPKVTAVSSTDNIDQSQVVSDSGGTLGAVDRDARAQQFTPTKKNLTGVVFRKGASTGTYTGNITLTLRTDNADKPSATILATKVYLNAAWEALTNDTDETFATTQTLTIGSKYWIVVQSSTTDDASNYTTIRTQGTGTYAGGISAFSSDGGTTWTTSGVTADFYFKTLYSKNTTNFTVSTDTETWSLSTSPNGWENGLERDGYNINAITPLTLAPGVNNIYYSSNGPDTADGEVDPSLQMIVGGRIKTGGSNKGVHRTFETTRRKRPTNYGAFNQH